MMSCVPLETCWAFKKFWNNKFYYKAASCWYFCWVICDVRIHEYQNLTSCTSDLPRGNTLLKPKVNFFQVTQRYIQEYRNLFFKFVASCCLKPSFNQNLHEQFTEHLSVMGSEVIRGDINHQQDSPWIYIKSLQDARLLVKLLQLRTPAALVWIQLHCTLITQKLRNCEKSSQIWILTLDSIPL